MVMAYSLSLDYGECSSVGRALDCGSSCRGFESHRSPQIFPAHSFASAPPITSRRIPVRANRSAGSLCESGEIGRRPGLRIQCLRAWGFNSPLSHHVRSPQTARPSTHHSLPRNHRRWPVPHTISTSVADQPQRCQRQIEAKCLTVWLFCQTF